MKIVSISENQKVEKRIAITPEIAKKYISLGIDVSLPENYASHLGLKDEEYKEFGVSILKDENENQISKFINLNMDSSIEEIRVPWGKGPIGKQQLPNDIFDGFYYAQLRKKK